MKVAIVGYGVEGKSNLNYYRHLYPDSEIVVFDEREQLADMPDGVETVLGKGAFGRVGGFDLVLRSPSIAPDRIGQSDHQWSSTREFLRKSPAPIIGVTGSKGKGTTCSFIAAIMRRHLADRPNSQVHLIGNIGVPVLDVLPDVNEDDIVVYEMSSFQLWDVTQSPHVAVVTMIEPDHLNVHKDFNDYVNAKMNILKYQQDGDTAVFNQESPVAYELAKQIIPDTGADAFPFPNKDFVHFYEGDFYCEGRKICPTSQVKLPGQHNLLNACAAIAATWEITGHDVKAIADGLADFNGLPHRLKFVREVNQTKFYDDSIATTPGSAIAAVKSFDQPKVLILGGSDKGANYHELGQIIESGNVRAVLAIGSNRSKIIEQVSESTKVPIIDLPSTDMKDIVDTAYDLSNPGDIVILSPAAASFDMFKSYSDRGNQFIAAVNNLD